MLIFPTYQTILTKPADSGGHVTTDLDTYYDFGNSSCYQSSSSDVTDLSGNGNGATVMNHSYASYSSNQGGHIILTYQSEANKDNNQKIQFDTFNPLRTVGSGPFTLEFWFNPLYTTANNGHLFAHYPGSENTRFLIRKDLSSDCRRLKVSSQFLTAWTEIDTDCYISGTGLSVGDPYGWEHLVVSRESQNTDGVKFYRNNSLIGEETSTLTYSDSDYTGSLPACIGEKPQTTYSFNSGCPLKLGIFRLYIGTALTSTDVATHWNLDKSRFGL